MDKMDTFKLFVLLCFILDLTASKKEINIAVVLPENAKWSFSISRVRPAMEVALDTLYNNTTLISDLDIKIRYADSLCDAAHGINEAFNFYLHNEAHVYFGPCCDYAAAPIARQVPFWDLPMITTGAMAGDFGRMKKQNYALLTRVGANFNSLAEFIVDVLANFKWKRVELLYQPKGQDHIVQGFCHLAADGIHRGIALSGQGIQQDYFKFDSPSQIKLESEIGVDHAVIVMCASSDSVREIMLRAAELNFDNGEYVFFNIDLFGSKADIEQPWMRNNDIKEENELAQHAYESLMTVTLMKPKSRAYKTFSSEVKDRAAKEGFQYGEEEVNSFVGSFYDALFLYAMALNETLKAGIDPRNGTYITQRMWNRTMEGITGTVSIDEKGDRNADYSLLDLSPKDGIFKVVANYYGSSQSYEDVEDSPIHWPGKLGQPPKDNPDCGFDGSGCPGFPYYAIIIIVLGSLLVTAVISFVAYNNYQMKKGLAEVNWRVKWDDVVSSTMEQHKLERYGSRMSLVRRGSDTESHISADTFAVHLSNAANKQIYTETAVHKGALVAIKKINRSSFSIAKPLKLEFKRMRDLQNDNVVRFIGVCIDHPHQCILTEYCPKGSLQDVLENEQVKLDNTFKFSLMQDIVRGLAYLHSSEIKSHGNLKSTNCVVDSRFGVKITDFGLHSLRGTDDHDEENEYQYYRGKLWTAPELLRLHNAPPEGTQKGDIYSFAIICQEIAYREGAFFVRGNEDLSPQDIYRKVKNGQRPYFRPTIDDLHEFSADKEFNEDLGNMIKKCWSEDPMERPDSHALKSMIRKMSKSSDSGNILDSLLVRMEQYANNLETLVEERTAAYLEQKKKAEDLLYMMLPKSVAGQLMQGESVTAEEFDACTIYFSDIVGFTKLSSESEPMQVVDLLNDLYTAFDSVIDSFDCYKVETIGDAYMVVSGIPLKNGNTHAREVARVSIGLLNAVRSFTIRHRPDDQLRLRIGIHSGPAVAGVVGLKMPRYCLFGDTVNTASRMESNGEPLKIHVSPFTKEILDTFETFKLELRGPVEMKGKGKIITWWLHGENHPDFPDFAPPETW